ncbi:MAG: hypothetical protein EBV03_11185 [Proteobacteria bacterium]|nr:hypothetical protein [Pseudomonadota bacterium]
MFRYLTILLPLLLLAGPSFATDEEAETELMEAIHAELEDGDKAPAKEAVKPDDNKATKPKTEKKKTDSKAEKPADKPTEKTTSKNTEKPTDKTADKKGTNKKEEVKKEEPKKTDKETVKEEKLGALECPKRISVSEQKTDKKLPAGFTSFSEVASSYWLKAAFVYSGEKPERVDPDKSTESTAEYTLLDNGKVSYWLVCAYGDTSLKLKKPLDKAFSKCALSAAENPANPAGPRLLTSLSCN